MDSTSIKALSDQVLNLECSDALCSVAESDTLALWDFAGSFDDKTSNRFHLLSTEENFVEVGVSPDFIDKLKISSKVLDGSFYYLPTSASTCSEACLLYTSPSPRD